MDEFRIESGVPVGDVVRRMIKTSGYTQTLTAEHIGISKQSMTNRIRDNKFYALEFIRIAELTGYALTATQERKAAGVHLMPGVGRPCKMNVDKITYDTAASNAICHSPTVDKRFIELYRDKADRFFVVSYTDWEGAHDYITPITAKDAKELYIKYGDGSVDRWFE